MFVVALAGFPKRNADRSTVDKAANGHVWAASLGIDFASASRVEGTGTTGLETALVEVVSQTVADIVWKAAVLD